jgi:aspartate aminotransferase
MPQLAERLDRLSESATLKMARLSRELKNQGAEIINLSVGEPDFDTPRHIKDAAIRAINDGVTSYPPVPGFPELRKAVADKYQQDLGLSYEPSQVVVSTGGKQTLINILMTIVDPGDEIVLPAPYWVSYPEMIKMVGGELIPIPTTVDVDYKITPEQLQAAITDKTRAVMLCSPSNPTGSVYSEEELKQLAAVLEQYPDLYIISDEIYEYINFRGTQHSIAQFGNLQERTMIVSGVSKGFAMTGWRIGFMVAPQAIADGCTKIQGQFTSGANAMAQVAATEAISGDRTPTYQMRDAFQQRRDLVMDKLSAIPGIRYNKPEGAFYLFADIRELYGTIVNGKAIQDSEAFCMTMLNEANVSLVPGIAFGDDNCIRFSFAASEDELSTAIDRLRNLLT